MHYKLKSLTAMAVTAVMLFSTDANAASSLDHDIYVGDVVSISAADLRVQNDYRSMDEVTKEYTQDKEKISSNGTLIDSGDGKLNDGTSIISGLVSDKDLLGTLPSRKKETLSY